ncbi:hypothetical protein, partial [Shinella zoogloeoides]
MPIFSAQKSPNTLNWQNIGAYEINSISDNIINSIISEFKSTFPEKSGIIRISKKKKDKLYSDLGSVMEIYSTGIIEEIKYNSSKEHEEFENTIENLYI